MEMTPSLLRLCSQAGLTHGCVEFLTELPPLSSLPFFRLLLSFCVSHTCAISSAAQIVPFLKDLSLTTSKIGKHISQSQDHP